MADAKKNSRFRNDMREIYESRTILYSLVRKNLFGRYKNSVLGFGWHFVMPVILMVLYYVVFTEIRTSVIPDFWIYVSSAIFPFTFMTSNLAGGAGAILSNGGMVKKMYFPREILVLAYVISNFIVMIIGYAIVLVLAMMNGYGLTVYMFLLPVIFVLVAMFATGYVLLFSSVTVYVHDVQYFLSSINMVFFFSTPMFFVGSEVSGILGKIIWLNPFTYYVEAFHSIVYFGECPELKILVMCLLLPVVSLTIGTVVFRKLKRGFAERL